MRGALISALSSPPEVTDLDEPQAGRGEILVSIEAVALNPLDISVGSGRFYGGHPPLPYVPGCEAVGRTDGDSLVYLFGEDRGVTARAEALAPEPMGQEHHVLLAGLILIGSEITPKEHPFAQHAMPAGRDLSRDDDLRRVADREIQRTARPEGLQSLERCGSFFPLEILGR